MSKTHSPFASLRPLFIPRSVALPMAALAGLLLVGGTAGCSRSRVPTIDITPRSAWANAEPLQDRLVAHTPDRLTVHHAGVKDDGTEPGDKKMRGLLHFSLNDKPWGDVPYHFIIDRQGHVWEGRALEYAPDTNTGYDVAGHVGICVNGDLTKQPLLECQYRALVDLLVKLSAELKIPDDRIAGHMDFSPGKTDCPGALEHYVRDGTLVDNMRAVRRGHNYMFELRSYDPTKMAKSGGLDG